MGTRKGCGTGRGTGRRVWDRSRDRAAGKTSAQSRTALRRAASSPDRCRDRLADRRGPGAAAAYPRGGVPVSTLTGTVAADWPATAAALQDQIDTLTTAVETLTRLVEQQAGQLRALHAAPPRAPGRPGDGRR